MTCIKGVRHSYYARLNHEPVPPGITVFFQPNLSMWLIAGGMCETWRKLVATNFIPHIINCPRDCNKSVKFSRMPFYFVRWTHARVWGGFTVSNWMLIANKLCDYDRNKRIIQVWKRPFHDRIKLNLLQARNEGICANLKCVSKLWHTCTFLSDLLICSHYFIYKHLNMKYEKCKTTKT